MSAETFFVSFLVMVALSIVVPAIQRWRLRRLVRASLGIERICRNADLVERELRFSVVDSLKFADGSSVIRVSFFFEHGMSGVSGNGWVGLDSVDVRTGSEAQNHAVETQVISAIEKARSFYTNAT